MNEKTVKDLELFAAEIRLETAKMVATRGFGHIGGSLSIVDVLAALYGKIMQIDPQNPSWEDRDLCVLSKGHAGPALYATLALKGYFPMEWLSTLNQPGTRLPSHCDRNLTPGVDMTTGSLGQGVSTAIGMTLGRKLAGNPRYTFLFVGDGEANEGQVWEGAMFSAQNKLDHMIWFIDYNRKQLDGCLKDVMDIAPLKDKFESFGFHTQEIDGHDMSAILRSLEEALAVSGKPHCIILNTVKGKGIPELEETELNHHVTFDGDYAKRSIQHVQNQLDAMRGADKNV